jgi:hypothetical protein
MFNVKKLTKALLAAGIIATAGMTNTASAGVVFGFNTGNIPGATVPFYSFLTDEITLTSIGLASIALTDTDGNGVLDGSFGDTFAETGLVSAVNFQLANINIPVGTSGIGLDYELLAVYSLGGVAGTVGTDLMAIMTTGAATIFYDETPNSIVDGGAVAIGTLAIPPGGGDCVVTAFSAFTEGSCKMSFDFAAAAGVGTGIWTVGGLNLAGNPADSMTIDININNSVPPVAPVYPGGPGSTQNISIDHDGSAVINIPEPGTLALLGAALLGIVGFQRRRQSS